MNRKKTVISANFNLTNDNILGIGTELKLLIEKEKLEPKE